MTDDLDARLDEAVEALRRYVGVARGVREEFDPEQADLDPRVEQAADALGLALGRLEDRFSAQLGFDPAIGPAWEGEPDDDVHELDDPDDDPSPVLDADAFSMGLVVGVDAATSPDQLDGVLGLLDDAAASVVERLESEGFVVTQYFVARGDHTGFADVLDDDRDVDRDDDRDDDRADGDDAQEDRA